MDNAFERARAAYGTGAYDDATLEFLFPQLKESEDERIRKAIIKSLDLPFMEAKIEGTDVTYEEAVAWLEKQKHIEWSEEDEDMLNCCISSIEEAKENRYAYKETDGDTSYDHEIDWLKSLRPSWKPSEEQMKEYSYWYRNFIESGLASPTSKAVTVLGELLEQLNRLM